MGINDALHELTDQEQALLERYDPFYRDLETGARVPTTEAQARFAAVCRGQTTAKTEHERAYARYMRHRVAEEERRRDAAAEALPEHEEGDPGPGWFTDGDWKRLRAQAFDDMRRRHRTSLHEPKGLYAPCIRRDVSPKDAFTRHPRP